MYDELRRVAAAYMRRERPGQTLQATALVHEAYLRLAQAGTPWHDQRHFVGIAARSMRQILVERARARGAQKRWGGMNRVSITDSLPLAADPETMLPALDEAINKLEQLDAEQAKIVELRYFAGMSVEEAADVMGMSPATLKRRWALARAWLFRELSASEAALTTRQTMTPEQRRRARDLFEHALEHEPADLLRWLERGRAGRFRRARRSALAARPPLARGLVSHPAGRRSRPAPARRGAHARARHGARLLHRRPRDRARRHGARVSRVGRPARPHRRAEGARRRS